LRGGSGGFGGNAGECVGGELGGWRGGLWEFPETGVYICGFGMSGSCSTIHDQIHITVNNISELEVVCDVLKRKSLEKVLPRIHDCSLPTFHAGR
jgi:hypothetical protein